MSLKLKTMTLHVVIAGCMSMAFYARGRREDWRRRALYWTQRHLRRPVLKGASQAVADINAAGGIKGEKIVLVQGMTHANRSRRWRWPTGWWMKRKSPPWWGTLLFLNDAGLRGI